MNIQRLYDCIRPRHRAWAKSSELTAGLSDGSYIINDSAVAGELGFGSEIIVIDKPGTVLFYDDVDGLAYEWTTAEEDGGEADGGGDEEGPGE